MSDTYGPIWIERNSADNTRMAACRRMLPNEYILDDIGERARWKMTLQGRVSSGNRHLDMVTGKCSDVHLSFDATFKMHSIDEHWNTGRNRPLVNSRLLFALLPDALHRIGPVTLYIEGAKMSLRRVANATIPRWFAYTADWYWSLGLDAVRGPASGSNEHIHAPSWDLASIVESLESAWPWLKPIHAAAHRHNADGAPVHLLALYRLAMRIDSALPFAILYSSI